MPVYLDNNATTPVDPRVLEAMLPYLKERFGNAASRTHAYGWTADEAVEIAREQTAALIGADKNEIIFTSGATESVNLALKGLVELQGNERRHIITCKTEHKATLDTCLWLSERGCDITWLGVNREGLIDPEELKSAITEKTLVVCIMMANNETGVVQPVAEIGWICRQRNVFFFTDATQAAGKIRIDVNEQHVDLLCFSSHKIYGPKGAGALYVRRKNPRVTIAAQIHGGGHERGLRSGTINVPAIAGMGKACEIAMEEWLADAGRISKLRSHLEQKLTHSGKAFINGNIRNRLPNTTNLCFHPLSSAEFIKTFPELAVATGSACTSARNEPSHVLKAMGLSDNESQSSIRFSLGRFTTEEEIEYAGRIIAERLGL